jgi:exopolyphosphatase
MTSASSNTCIPFPSVAEFLQQTSSSRPLPGSPPRLAIGNPAGDADSIISSIASAYLDTFVRQKPTTPIISIPLDDLKSLRPETKYLLALAGVTTELNDSSFVAIDDPDGLPDIASVTLVDHNQLTVAGKSNGWKVETILDHHMDEGSHTDTCDDTSEDRIVAFDASTSSALVASTCTLIVERWKNYVSTSSTNESDIVPIPPSLSILLLGVILLDSINLSVKAGKVTPRDQQAVEALYKGTDWSALQLPSEICRDDKPGAAPDLTKLFDTLQNQKFRPEFWTGLTALQALKLDYKSFTVESAGNDQNASTFGVSSILQSMAEFSDKPNVWNSIADEYFPMAQFFGVMFMTFENGSPKRQILLTSPDEKLVHSLVRFLENEGSLQIGAVAQTKDSDTGLYRVELEQGNAKASRKQVVPILMEFLKEETK